MIVAATGHRPEKLGGYSTKIRYSLGGLATDYLARNRPSEVISGMALGWDMAVAAAAVALDIPFVAAVPFRGQECRWPKEAQDRYRWLLSEAEEVVIITDGELFGRQVAKALQDRNEWMVDRADRMIALWDGSWGGTFNCIRYAEKKDVPVDNLWRQWTIDEDLRDILA